MTTILHLCVFLGSAESQSVAELSTVSDCVRLQMCFWRSPLFNDECALRPTKILTLVHLWSILCSAAIFRSLCDLFPRLLLVPLHSTLDLLQIFVVGS